MPIRRFWWPRLCVLSNLKASYLAPPWDSLLQRLTLPVGLCTFFYIVPHSSSGHVYLIFVSFTHRPSLMPICCFCCPRLCVLSNLEASYLASPWDSLSQRLTLLVGVCTFSWLSHIAVRVMSTFSLRRVRPDLDKCLTRPCQFFLPSSIFVLGKAPSITKSKLGSAEILSQMLFSLQGVRQ